MARAYAKRLSAGLAIVDKRRTSPDKTEVMHILGNVKGKSAVIVDDIVATAGSLIEAIEALKKKGVTEAYATISHGILSGSAIARINKCAGLKELVITDSIPLSKKRTSPKITVLPIAPLLAEAINRIHNEESISCLFDEVKR
jgi:ribose-phosphate pyrophosphokinase